MQVFVPSRSRGLVAAAVVSSMLFVQATPARAFLSALDPAGWAVVAQMAAVLSQAIAIKRQVENVRNQARASFFGKLAPLNGKLRRVQETMTTVRTKTALQTVLPSTSTVLLAESMEPFNRPPVTCTGAASDPFDCMPPDSTLSTAVLDAATNRASTAFVTAPFAAGGYAAFTGGSERYQAATRALGLELAADTERLFDVSEAAEARRAAVRAQIETNMGVIEDWRGCQPAPHTGATIVPANDDRIPCATNDGLGRQDPSGGTDGLQEQLVLNLQALDQYQDGDISQAQLDSLQTQALVQLARIEAARTEATARRLEQEQEQQMLAESARRQATAYIEQHVRCRADNGPLSYWQPTAGGSPAGGSCITVADRTAAGVANIIASALALQ